MQLFCTPSSTSVTEKQLHKHVSITDSPATTHCETNKVGNKSDLSRLLRQSSDHDTDHPATMVVKARKATITDAAVLGSCGTALDSRNTHVGSRIWDTA